MDEGTERLNNEDNLDIVLTRRRKSKNGSMGGLMGTATVLGRGALHWQLMASWLPSLTSALLMTLRL